MPLTIKDIQVLEQRGRGTTCAHQPAGKAKSNEDLKLCDGGDRSNHFVAPPRAIALDDTDEKHEGPCHFQEQRPGTKRPQKGGNVDDVVDCPGEVPAWLMGLCGFLGDLSCGMPRCDWGKGAGCGWVPCFFPSSK